MARETTTGPPDQSTIPRAEDRRAKVPAIDDAVMDMARSRVGLFRGEHSGRFFLRPIGGGVEWEVGPEYARPATSDEFLSARVAAENERSRRVHQ